MSYHPCVAVLTDGHGKYLGVVVCDCDPAITGDPGPAGSWELDYENCPVHSRVQHKDSAAGALQPQGEISAPAPLATGTAPAAALSGKESA